MKSVELPTKTKRKVLSMLGELAQIPMPREGKRDVQTMGRYLRDAEQARTHTMTLLNQLAGYQAEAEDLAEARSALLAEAKEALDEAAAWLAERKKEDWK